MPEFEERLLEWEREASSKSRILRDEALSKHSSLRIGGPARFWIEVGSREDLQSLLFRLGKKPICCVGLGSNALFPDEGIDGPVLRFVNELASWNAAADEGGGAAEVRVGAGVVNAHLVRGLLKEGWIGAEFLALIPGTFGGAVALNAGTKEKELSAILEKVELAVRKDGSDCWAFEEWPASKLEMKYRSCALPPGSLVLSGTVRVVAGEAAEAKKRVKKDKEQRNRTQPYRLASVGSTFANPVGDYAGRLIEAAGLKGTRIGGARISEQHANFFINEEESSAEDFLSLMALARQRVRKQFGVELEPEVRFIGFDGRARMRDLEKEWEDRDV